MEDIDHAKKLRNSLILQADPWVRPHHRRPVIPEMTFLSIYTNNINDE